MARRAPGLRASDELAVVRGEAEIDQAFAVTSFLLGAQAYPDVSGPEDAAIELDGLSALAPWTKVGAGPFGTFRLNLTKSGQGGAHVLRRRNR